MKLRTYAPALIAIIGLVVVWRYMAGRGGEEAAPPPSAPVATSAPVAKATPTARPSVPATAPTGTPEEPAFQAPPSTDPVVAPTKAPRALTEDEAKDHIPKAKLEKMTLEERIAAAKEHVTVIRRRVELMQQEIADLEKKGDKTKADEQRVVMARLTAHVEKLQKAIDEGREPE